MQFFIIALFFILVIVLILVCWHDWKKKNRASVGITDGTDSIDTNLTATASV